MSFSVSVDKSNVVNNEAYTITTTSSTTLHSVDVYMNQQYYDKRVCSFPSNSFSLSDDGILFFYYFDLYRSVTVTLNGNLSSIRINDQTPGGGGSYVVDPIGGSSQTLNLGTPLYMTVYNNYLYILQETEGYQILRYNLFGTPVTQDLSSEGITICNYIVSQCRAESKFTFGSNGICYLTNGIYDGIQYYTTLMMININTGYTQVFSASDVPSSYPAIAMDSNNYIYQM